MLHKFEWCPIGHMKVAAGIGYFAQRRRKIRDRQQTVEKIDGQEGQCSMREKPILTLSYYAALCGPRFSRD
jgi:hypothetical protein